MTCSYCRHWNRGKRIARISQLNEACANHAILMHKYIDTSTVWGRKCWNHVTLCLHQEQHAIW
jgi:hypothetical protein